MLSEPDCSFGAAPGTGNRSSEKCQSVRLLRPCLLYTSSITDRDGANGKALVLNGAGAWLNVVGENNASLLTGLEEFTVSYDSYSEGEGGAWSFFAAPNANSLVYGNEYRCV